MNRFNTNVSMSVILSYHHYVLQIKYIIYHTIVEATDHKTAHVSIRENVVAEKGTKFFTKCKTLQQHIATNIL